MFLFKLGLVFNATIAFLGEWHDTNHWLPKASMYIAFICFVVLALASIEKSVEEMTRSRNDDDPP